jgi:hypothetical protein
MSHTVIIHLENEDPICGEIEKLPAPTDTILTVYNPRRRDGKDVSYLSSDVILAIWPISHIAFVEVMPSEGEEKIISFVRE